MATDLEVWSAINPEQTVHSGLITVISLVNLLIVSYWHWKLQFILKFVCTFDIASNSWSWRRSRSKVQLCLPLNLTNFFRRRLHFIVEFWKINRVMTSNVVIMTSFVRHSVTTHNCELWLLLWMWCYHFCSSDNNSRQWQPLQPVLRSGHVGPLARPGPTWTFLRSGQGPTGPYGRDATVHTCEKIKFFLFEKKHNVCRNCV